MWASQQLTRQKPTHRADPMPRGKRSTRPTVGSRSPLVARVRGPSPRRASARRGCGRSALGGMPAARDGGRARDGCQGISRVIGLAELAHGVLPSGRTGARSRGHAPDHGRAVRGGHGARRSAAMCPPCPCARHVPAMCPPRARHESTACFTRSPSYVTAMRAHHTCPPCVCVTATCHRPTHDVAVVAVVGHLVREVRRPPLRVLVSQPLARAPAELELGSVVAARGGVGERRPLVLSAARVGPRRGLERRSRRGLAAEGVLQEGNGRGRLGRSLLWRPDAYALRRHELRQRPARQAEQPRSRGCSRATGDGGSSPAHPGC